MPEYNFNPFTNKLDETLSNAELNARYVRKIGDTMSGELIISPAGDTSLTANKNIVLKAGQKLIFDGA